MHACSEFSGLCLCFLKLELLEKKSFRIDCSLDLPTAEYFPMILLLLWFLYIKLLMHCFCSFSVSKVAAYEFTTLTCIPGVIMYKGAKIQVTICIQKATSFFWAFFILINIWLSFQLLDLPGIIEGAKDGKGRGRQVISTSKTFLTLFSSLKLTWFQQKTFLIHCWKNCPTYMGIAWSLHSMQQLSYLHRIRVILWTVSIYIFWSSSELSPIVKSSISTIFTQTCTSISYSQHYLLLGVRRFFIFDDMLGVGYLLRNQPAHA